MKSKTFQCRYCGYSGQKDDFEHDFTNHRGFWCPMCDSFTYYDRERRSYLLIFEDKDKNEVLAGSPCKTQVSPLRYPGGKSRLVGEVYNRLRKGHSESFVEPFSGGASVGLALLMAGRIKRLYLNDIDYGIYALYKEILENTDSLIKRIENYNPTREDFFAQRNLVLNGYKDASQADAAWALLVTNRCAFSGIAMAGPMKNISARWNSKSLMRRIKDISAFKDSIRLYNMSADVFIEEMYYMKNTTLFIDPPYYVKGSRLYPNYFTKEEHQNLGNLLESLHAGIPGADIIITYDFCKEICELYEYPKTEILGRRYSVARQ